MFHVKHFCVKRTLANPPPDVSRETIFSAAAHAPARAAMFHVKHLCVIPFDFPALAIDRIRAAAAQDGS